MFKFFKRSKSNSGSSSNARFQRKSGNNPSSENPVNDNDNQIDIVFLQDTTASQEPYINSARTAIRGICKKISTSTNISSRHIRFGLVAFRDHPPQDDTYVTKNFGFTSNMAVMKGNLKRLDADGGGDGPEASTAALAEALNLEWRKSATKMVVLITDAPPHGIGEKGDAFDSSPDQNDPLDIARQMAEQGITLFVVACELTLSTYRNAVDFYKALTEITGGKMFPLTMADRLGDYIAGTAVETIETEKLISQYSADIVNNVYEQSRPLEVVMEDIHEKLKEKGVVMKQMEVENVYKQSTTMEENIEVWKKAEKISYGRTKVSGITEPRMQEEYSSGKMAPAVEMVETEVKYAQAQRVVMQSVMRSSKVTASGMVKKSC